MRGGRVLAHAPLRARHAHYRGLRLCCASRRRRRFRGCADSSRGVHVSTERPARPEQPCGLPRARPGVSPPPLPSTPSDERAPYCQPAAGVPESETAHGFVNGMLGKCVRLALFLHTFFPNFSPGRRVLGFCFPPLTDRLGGGGGMCAYVPERQEGSVCARCAERRTGFQAATLLFCH